MFYFKKKRKQMIALCLSAALSVGSLTAYAATEYWNDASTKPMVETKHLFLIILIGNSGKLAGII